ncbi:Mini-ribonuclease 3 [filamentous cyanobacterium LEGE 07170]|nr:Mini-ribonuclease 3 [filamentous cyanobacterium LEGE 07170]
MLRLPSRMSNSLDCLTIAVSSTDLQRLSPLVLAHIGDAVFELSMRTLSMLPPQRLQTYHQQVVQRVRAETQSLYLAWLQPQLTDAEREIVRRGRNAAPRGPKRVDPAIYQDATALEALLGYLYLTDTNRLETLLLRLRDYIQTSEV